MNLWISATYTILTCGALVAVEILKRKTKISAEYTRRIAHVLIGVMGILGYLLGPVWLYATVIGCLTLVLLIFRRGDTLSSITGVARKSYGDIFLPLGLLAAIPFTLNSPTYYVVSILITTFADSLCGLISDLQKKSAHTVTGSLVFFLMTFIIIAVFTEISWIHIVWGAALLTIIERISKKGSDNLTIPVAASLIFLLF